MKCIRTVLTLVAVISLAPGVAAQVAAQDPLDREPDSVYVGTPSDVVARMLELANVTKDDLVYDLGCGDGRIVVTAAKKYGCRVVAVYLLPRQLEKLVAAISEDEAGLADCFPLFRRSWPKARIDGHH